MATLLATAEENCGALQRELTMRQQAASQASAAYERQVCEPFAHTSRFVSSSFLLLLLLFPPPPPLSFSCCFPSRLPTTLQPAPLHPSRRRLRSCASSSCRATARPAAALPSRLAAGLSAGALLGTLTRHRYRCMLATDLLPLFTKLNLLTVSPSHPLTDLPLTFSPSHLLTLSPSHLSPSHP